MSMLIASAGGVAALRGFRTRGGLNLLVGGADGLHLTKLRRIV